MNNETKFLAHQSDYIPDSEGRYDYYLMQSDKKFYVVSGWNLDLEKASQLISHYKFGSDTIIVHVWSFNSLIEAHKIFDINFDRIINNQLPQLKESINELK